MAFQVLLYINLLESLIFKLLEQIARVGTSDTRDQKVHGSNQDMSKAVFSQDMAGTCISFCFFRMILVRLASELNIRGFRDSML